MNRFKLLFYSFLVLSFSACDSDDEKDVQDPKERMLTAKTWVITAAVADPPLVLEEVTISDLFPYIPSCSKDDMSKFNADGTLLFDEGPSKCASADPQTVTSKWSFNTDRTILTTTLGTETVSYKVVDISDTMLKFSSEEVEEETGQEYTLTITYTAKQ